METGSKETMKYKNQKDVKLFGHYDDPYKDRRVKGPERPESPLPVNEPDFKRSFDKDKVYFSWLGHSSIFLNMSGISILVDPVFSEYASPIHFGPKRFDGPVVSKDDFLDIDLVLITHNHYDHLDKRTIKSFDEKVKSYIVPKGVKKNLIRFGVNTNKIQELEWEQSLVYKELEITCLPTQHDSGRLLIDMNRTLWCSYLIKNKDYCIYDSGDGGFTDYFKIIQKKYGNIDLAIMECGQYNERWHTIHMFPEECVEASFMLKAKLTIPVHYGAYVLSDHAWNEPIIRFKRRANEVGISYKVPNINEILIIEK